MQNPISIKYVLSVWYDYTLNMYNNISPEQLYSSRIFSALKKKSGVGVYHAALRYKRLYVAIRIHKSQSIYIVTVGFYRFRLKLDDRHVDVIMSLRLDDEHEHVDVGSN